MQHRLSLLVRKVEVEEVIYNRMEGQDNTSTTEPEEPSSRVRATAAKSVEGKVGEETIAKEKDKKKKLCVVIKKKSNIKIKTGMIKVKPNRGPGTVAVSPAAAVRRNVITTTDHRKRNNNATSTRRTLGKKVLSGGGLPSKTKTSIRTSEDNDDNDDNNDDDDEFGGMDEHSLVLPSDTFVAIQSLQEGSQGLHIPCNSPTQSLTIQAVLESQIYSRFDDNHASTIYQELQELYTTKQIKALVCWGIGSSNTNTTTATTAFINSRPQHLTQQQRRRRLAIVTTSDYISGIWMAHESFLHTHHNNKDSTSGSSSSSRPVYQQPLPHDAYHKITEWFTFHLKSTWTEPAVISKRDLKSKWEDLILSYDSTSDHNQGNNIIIVTLSHALYYLQVQLQVLMRDGSPLASSTIDDDNEMYHLWLPQWGVVLKAWTTAQQQVLSQIKRSRGGVIGASSSATTSDGTTKRRKSGEISEQNLLHTNRNANISTKFLLDDLLSQGVIRRIQRPFGTFIQLE